MKKVGSRDKEAQNGLVENKTRISAAAGTVYSSLQVPRTAHYSTRDSARLMGINIVRMRVHLSKTSKVATPVLPSTTSVCLHDPGERLTVKCFRNNATVHKADIEDPFNIGALCTCAGVFGYAGVVRWYLIGGKETRFHTTVLGFRSRGSLSRRLSSNTLVYSIYFQGVDPDCEHRGACRTT